MENRNLAFYKESGEAWTQDEFKTILAYCGDATTDEIGNRWTAEHNCAYIYDKGHDNEFMWAWGDSAMKKHPVTKISYEKTFNAIQLKKFKVK